MELQKVQGFVMIFILVGVLIGVGMVVIHEVGVTGLTDTTDTVTLLNGSAVALTGSYILESTVSVTNSSGNTLDSSNYTIAATAGTITLDAGLTALDNTSWDVAYSYGTNLDSYVAMAANEDAIGDFPDWFAVIVVMLISAIIIGMVMKGFSGGNL